MTGSALPPRDPLPPPERRPGVPAGFPLRMPRAPAPAADAPPPAPPAPVAAPRGPALPPPPAVRRSVQGGRFARWHLEPTPVPEEEGWLLTYLDVITLLLVLMVVMLAYSEPASRKTPAPSAAAPVASAAPAPGEGGPSAGPVPVPGGSIVPPRPRLQDQLPLQGLGPQVEVIGGETQVRFRIASELLFASGEASLTPDGQQLLDRLLPAFNTAVGHYIVVEGHTDNQPIQTARFPSNWELAAGRAGSVVRHLQARGVNPTRLRATGYADTRPVAPNDTREGQAANRRVELLLEAPPPAGR